MQLIAVVGKKLANSLDEFVPDTIISTYPLGGLIVDNARRHGLTASLITYVTDPAAHRIWISETGRYLATWTATATEIWRHGPASIAVVPPAVHPAFGPATCEGDRLRLRAEMGLLAGALALLTSGSWGVGDMAAAARDIRDFGLITPVVICGRNRELVKDLSKESGMIVIGWTDRMPDLMRTCDVAVLNSGGLTLAEARVTALPVIHYRPLPGQGIANANVCEEHGIAPWPKNCYQLLSALTEAIGTRPFLTDRARNQLTADDELLAEIQASCERGSQKMVAKSGRR